MFKKLIYITLCFGSLNLYGSDGLKRAVDDLDVQEVVKILENKAPTDNELICQIEALRDKNRSYEIREGLGMLAAIFGGIFIGAYLGDLYWKKTADPIDLVKRKNGEIHRMVGVLAAVGLGLWGATGYNAAEQAKTRTILHLLTHKIGERINFVQRL